MLTFALIIVTICLLPYEQGTPQADWRLGINIVNTVIILAAVVSYEIRELLYSGFDYFKDSSNLTDCLFLFTFGSAVATDVIYGTDYKDMEAHPHKETCRILYAFLIVFSFLKGLFLLRVFNNISFIIKMLRRVGEELMPFIILFISFIVVDSLVIMTLGFDQTELQNDPYQGVYSIGYSLFMLRTSIGDFEVDPFSELPMASSLVVWLFWVAIIFVNTIILLNFLIAVISDVYEQVMETRTEEIFQKKA